MCCGGRGGNSAFVVVKEKLCANRVAAVLSKFWSAFKNVNENSRKIIIFEYFYGYYYKNFQINFLDALRNPFIIDCSTHGLQLKLAFVDTKKDC